jgi:hypothetical protein
MSETVTHQTMADAVEQVQHLVRRRAGALRLSMGFDFRPSPNAPSTWDELQREYHACSCSRLPLRVSSEHNENTILGAEANLASRFWHDLTHLTLRQDFTRAGEIQVGQEQLLQAAAAGHPPGSLPWRLMFAETIGQTECCYRLGVFPADQIAFTHDYLDHGLPEAIRLEARRQHLVIVQAFQRRRDNEVIGSRHHVRPPAAPPWLEHPSDAA